MLGEYIVDVKSISKTYKSESFFKRLKKEKAIDNVDFRVKAGEVFSIIGLNGAGKTTIMNSILGLINVNEGKIRVFGKDKLKQEDFYKIGYLPENPSYPKEIKIKELLNYYAKLYNMEDLEIKKDIPELLEILDLKKHENEKIGNCSRGVKQKLGLIQAIMNSPKLVFLDEPMLNLDPMGRKLVHDLIKHLKSKGTTIIFNSHILNDVENLADRIAILDKGKILKIIDFRAYAEKTETLSIFINEEFGDFSKIASRFAKKLLKNDADIVINELAKNGIKIDAIEKERISLEKYFLEQIM